MKIKPEHLAYMHAAIFAIAPKIPTEEALRNDPRVKDAAKRRRWDACKLAGLSQWICDNLYTYANDDHVDTALREVMRDVDAQTAEGEELRRALDALVIALDSATNLHIGNAIVYMAGKAADTQLAHKQRGIAERLCGFLVNERF